MAHEETSPGRAPHRRTRIVRAITLDALAVTAACVLVVGCGGTHTPAAGSTAPTPAHSSASNPAELAFSKCMRTHGVPDFPDPGASVNGPANSIGGIEIPTTINMQSTAYLTAQHDCKALFTAAFPRPGGPGVSASQQAAILAHAQCMREHGVPNFPDPTFPAGGGIKVTDAGTDPQSPSYQHAEKVCQKHG